jgi:hypothetical protein
MKKRAFLFVLITTVLAGGCSVEKMYQKQQRRKGYALQQLGFKDLVKLYFNKEPANDPLEGIYSVSAVITKKSKGFFSSTLKEKELERKENYSTVAIIRDPGNPNREYLECSLDKDFLQAYPIVGGFTHATDGNILVYKHFEPSGKSASYAFTYDRATDLLEGEHAENNGSATITIKLTYLKLSPKPVEKSQALR